MSGSLIPKRLSFMMMIRDALPLLPCIAFITLPNIYATLFLKDVHHSPTPMILGTALATLWVVAVSSLPRRAVIWSAPFMIVAPALCVMMNQVGSQVNRWAILIVSEGNKEELGRFAGPAIIAGLGVLAAVWVCWWLFRHESLKPVPGRARIALALLAAAALSFKLLPDFTSGNSAQRENGIYKLQVTYPFGTLIEMWHAAIEQNGLSDRQSAIVKHSIGKRTLPPVKKRSLHVLVIGESARFKSLSVNGYERDTTPLLRQRKDLIWFPNMTACATITRHSVPLMLTGLPADRFEDTKTAPSVISIAGNCGYETYWFSTQYRQGIASKASAYFAPDAHIHRFLCLELGQSHFTNASQDEQLLPLLREVIDKKTTDSLVILHTMGSHWLFTARYPKSFAKWPADGLDANAILSGRLASQATRQKMLNAYDNTILYTDWVVHSLLNEVEKAGGLASFWYVADHGENGMDDPENPFRHGLVTRDVLHVPAFVWFSKDYRATYPDFVQRIETNAIKPLTSRMLFHTRMEIVGIDSDAQNDSLNLAHPDFKPEDQRLIMALDGTIVDYDKDVKE